MKALEKMGSCFSGALPTPPGDLGVPLGDGVFRIESRAQRESMVKVFVRSFLGSEKTDPEGALNWVLGPKLENPEDPRRGIMMNWLLTMGVKVCLDKMGGFALGAKLNNGDLAGLLLITTFPHKNGQQTIMEKLSFGFGMIPLLCCDIGCPPFGQMGDAAPGIKKRLAKLGINEQKKLKHMPAPHIYVNAVAVDPDAQGKGVSSKLMRTANAYADKMKLPLYLETSGEKNMAIYEHFGYKVVEKFGYDADGDPDNAKPHGAEYIMIRPFS